MVTDESTRTGVLGTTGKHTPPHPDTGGQPHERQVAPSDSSVRIGRGHATAKFILIGEHAVVYGRPAIALPMPALAMRATATPVDGDLSLDSEHFRGPLSQAPERLAPVRAALIATLSHLGLPDTGLVVRTESAIPIERGLGSSAAVSAAVVRALCDLAGVTPTPQELFELIQVSERVAHGSPSGLDAHTVTADGPIRFKDGIATPLPFGLEATFILADTGVKGQTRAAVGDLARLRERRPEWVTDRLDQIADLTNLSALAIEHNNVAELGGHLSSAHTILRELEVSSPELNTLVDAAENAGACGAKLTGGGRGGCMVAVAESTQHALTVAKALEAAGAVRTWLYSTGSATA
ncbi:MAG: mevalonate kinase [Mycetocola sp.]